MFGNIARRFIALALAVLFAFSFDTSTVPVHAETQKPTLSDVIIKAPGLPEVTEGSLWAGLVYLDVDSIEHYYGQEIARTSDDEYIVVVSLGMELRREYNGRYSAANPVQKFFMQADPTANEALVNEAFARSGKTKLRLIHAGPSQFTEFVDGLPPANI